MNFSEYQEKASTTALYPSVGNNLYYPALGLGGEVGEVLNKIKKVMRDHGGTVSNEYREMLRGELGDVLWYVAALARELNLDLNDIAQANLEKLFSRKERGTLSGDGDNR
ncbi:MAG: nucleoside triphosphate pyrophosphohydrolase family protein [Candidatus Uhrbacteria bacterium]|nr:nucleoside triphosphate pyrophosphohydrolase family protein [Candidatus Uhrbacteria bacterium]